MADIQDHRNDAKLLTPLLVMALIIVVGFAFYALTGQAPSASG
jgi:Tfp pilus assembly protein PilO